MSVGERVRELRLARRLSHQELAEHARLSRAFISQIESGRANPSVESLSRVAAALDVPLRVLFDERLEHPASPEAATRTAPSRQPDESLVAEVVRGDRRKVMWTYRGGRGALLTPNVQRLLEVTLEESGVDDRFARDDHAGRFSHPGEEVGFVLEGSVLVEIADQTFVLEAGDSIYLNAAIPHLARPVDDRPTRTIWVSTPPSF